MIEVVARNPQDLLEKVNGLIIKISDRTIILNTNEAVLVEINKPLKVMLMEIFSDPVISSTLFALGVMMLVLGLASPEFGAEIAGGIMILLGLIGHGFDVNLIGLFLVLVGAGLLVYDVLTQSFGAMAIGGIIARLG